MADGKKKKKSSTRGDGLTYGRGSGRTTALSRSKRSVTQTTREGRFKDTVTTSPSTGRVNVTTRKLNNKKKGG